MTVWKYFVWFCLIVSFLIYTVPAYATSQELFSQSLAIYKIQPWELNDYYTVKKNTPFGVVLHEDVSSKQYKEKLQFQDESSNREHLTYQGELIRYTQPGRFSMFAQLQFSTNKMYLNDGQEINISATSPLFQGMHPLHANSNFNGLASTINTLIFATSPFTIGLGLGAGFLLNSISSAVQNGIGDFFWGGFDGIGLSFVEYMFRKQPDLLIPTGTVVPFILKQDLKISKGIKKEKNETIKVTAEEAAKKINMLLQWGDLTGAIEYAMKTNQKDIYEKLIKDTLL